MKQITHEFKWDHIIAAIINEYSEDFDDGYWQLGVAIENTPANIPKMLPQNLEGEFPGCIIRFPYIRLEKVSGWMPLTVLIEKGVIHFGPNTNNSGPVEGSESLGENSNLSRESDSES